MRKITAVFFLFASVFLFVSGTIDLDNLFNYENQSIPAYITKDNTPTDNQITDEGATLGRVLFYDKKLSADNTISCGSCHIQEHAFSDLDTVSTGINGHKTPRHSMRLVNARFGDETKFRWDETAETLEEQMIIPIIAEEEMGYSGQNGMPSFADLITEMDATSYYPDLFTLAFGDATITEERIQKALAQFVRSIQSFDSKYDIGRAQVANDLADFPNFTNQENAGKQLFMEAFDWELDYITVQDVPGDPGGTFPVASRISGGFDCATCHVPPEFSIDPNSLNNGFVRPSSNFPGDPSWLDGTRSPTLRDLLDADGELNGGMFHSGQAIHIQDIFGHYTFRRLDEEDNPNLDPRLTRVNPNTGENIPIHLNNTAMERQRVFAFLATLTGTDVYTNEKWSDPFDENGNITLIGNVLPIELLSFTAQQEKDFVLLEWETSKETNNSHFILERLEENNTWRAVGNIQGAGTSEEANRYSFKDLQPMRGLNYYRLRQVDFDGTFSFSPRVSVDFIDNDFHLEVYPNPAKDIVQIKTNQDFEAITVYDLTGKMIKRSAYQNQDNLDFSDLNAGVYILSFKASQSKTMNKKLIINK